ncbi:hypothetical protein [Nocardia noduli]|uniref:hypothetical protein n=1 Tax=Nocardia noduli TaxID=2815722 RepID=UPI001C212C07|nr:hypothetical protein [Nocardia noduli]
MSVPAVSRRSDTLTVPDDVADGLDGLVERYQRIVATYRSAPDQALLDQRIQLRQYLDVTGGLGERDDLLARVQTADLATLIVPDGQYRATLRQLDAPRGVASIQARDERFASLRHAREWLADHAETCPLEHADALDLEATVTDTHSGAIVVSVIAEPVELAARLRESRVYDGTLLTGIGAVDTKRLDWLIEDYEAVVARVARGDHRFPFDDEHRMQALGREIAAMIAVEDLADSALRVWLRMANSDARLIGSRFWKSNGNPNRIHPPAGVVGSGFPRADLRVALEQYDELLLVHDQLPDSARPAVRRALDALALRARALLDAFSIWTGSDYVRVQWCLNESGDRPRLWPQRSLALPDSVAIHQRFGDLTTNFGIEPLSREELHQLLYLYQLLTVLAAEASPYRRRWAAPIAADHYESLRDHLWGHPRLSDPQKQAWLTTLLDIQLNPRCVLPSSPDYLDPIPPQPVAPPWVLADQPLRHWLLLRPENGAWIVRTYLEDPHDPQRWTRQAVLAYPDAQDMISALATGATYRDVRTDTIATLPPLDITTQLPR